MVPFVSPHGVMYILVAIDYMSKWVEPLCFQIMKVIVSQHFRRRIFILNLVLRELSLVMVDLIFSIICSKR